MTNNPFTNFKEIVDSYQNSPERSGRNGIERIMPARKCLQCKISLSSSNLGPYCCTACMNKHDAGIPAEKERDTTMLGFSKVFQQ